MKIVVIGGGPGGRTAAIEAAEIGEEVTLIENNKIGENVLMKLVWLYAVLTMLSSL